MLKRGLLTVLFVSLLALFGIPFAFAHETETPHEEPVEAEISITDLGIEKTGILPTNPFYFVKEWGRGLRLLFTPDPVKKAALELSITNEKAAELKQVTENNPDNDEALDRAISNYNKNIERLRARLESLKETSDNPNIDRLLDELTDRAIKHQQLFEELKVERLTLRERLEQAQDNIDETINTVPEKLDRPDKFQERLEKALNSQKESELKELKALSFLSRLEHKVSSTEVKERITQLKNDEGVKFDEKIKKIKEQVGKKTEVQAEEATRMVDEAKLAIKELELQLEKIKNGDAVLEKNRLNSVTVLLNQAKSHLREAEKFYKDEKYGAAYGQANSARLAARNALGQLLKRVERVDREKTPTSTVKSEGEEKRKEKSLEERIKEEKRKIERTKQSIKETRSKLPASGSAASGTE